MLTGVDGAERDAARNRTKQRFMLRIATLLVVIGATLAVAPAGAQVIFNDSPPRPPADVPNGGFPPQPPPVQYPGQSPPPAQQYPPPQQYQPPPPPPQRAGTQNPAARAPSGIQAQPLPPPPGASLAPPPVKPTNAPPPAPANAPPPQPADTSPQPDDTVVTQTPTQKIENGRAIFSGLDKITGRTISFDAAIGETVQFGALQVTARACYTRPPTEATNTDAFVDVDEVTLQGEIKRIFTGWMFASSPGLHAVEHPVYDVWLTDCAAPLAGPVAQSGPPPASPPVPAAATAAPSPKGARQPAPPPARKPVAPPAAAPATDD
jgi:hypothetical protein